MAITAYTPASKPIHTKSNTIARTDTTAKVLFGIPRDAIIRYFTISGTASNAGTTATLDIGTSADPDLLVDGVSVGGSTTIQFAGIPANINELLASDLVIQGLYAETGTASTVGGDWTVTVHYTIGTRGGD